MFQFILAHIRDEIQWLLAIDEVAMELNDSHYFFSLHVLKKGSLENENNDESLLVIIRISSMQFIDDLERREDLLKELDWILETNGSSLCKNEGIRE